jgi:hypothetical protein
VLETERHLVTDHRVSFTVVEEEATTVDHPVVTSDQGDGHLRMKAIVTSTVREGVHEEILMATVVLPPVVHHVAIGETVVVVKDLRGFLFLFGMLVHKSLRRI